VASVQAERLPLSKREKSNRQGRLTLDAHERFRPNEVAGWAEKRMSAPDGAHFDAVDLAHRPAENLRIDELDARTVSAKAAVADDQRERDCIDAEDQRPFLRHDVQQPVDTLSLYRRKDSGMDRGDGARMPAGKSEQILIGFFGGAQAIA
jgi:hypothetical protein